MSHEISLQHMAMADLAQRCEQETNRYFKRLEHDTSYCFELFRRAIQGRSKAAWEIICIQYQALVTGWVNQHHRFAASGEEVQYFVNGAFGKISATISPEKFPRFADLGSLLRYLKMCVHSVIVDHSRAAEYGNLYDIDDAAEEESEEPSPEEQAIEHSARQALWDLLATRLHDEKERGAIHASFVLDLKPQEIFEHFRGLFSDVDEIYRIKQNVITRLRRDPEFRKLFGGND